MVYWSLKDRMDTTWWNKYVFMTKCHELYINMVTKREEYIGNMVKQIIESAELVQF